MRGRDVRLIGVRSVERAEDGHRLEENRALLRRNLRESLRARRVEVAPEAANRRVVVHAEELFGIGFGEVHGRVVGQLLEGELLHAGLEVVPELRVAMRVEKRLGQLPGVVRLGSIVYFLERGMRVVIPGVEGVQEAQAVLERHFKDRC